MSLIVISYFAQILSIFWFSVHRAISLFSAISISSGPKNEFYKHFTEIRNEKEYKIPKFLKVIFRF